MKLPLQVMQPLSLQYEGAWYPSLILDFNEGLNLVVGVPQEKRVEVFIDLDSLVTVDLFLPDGIRRFQTVVLRRNEGSPPGLVLAWPKDLERIQRREAFRVPIELKAEASFQSEGMRDRRGMIGSTLDLSAGGVRLALPEPIAEGTLLDARIAIPGAPAPMQSCMARVVRWGERLEASASSRFWVACEFVQPSEAFRKEVTRFVFDIQREQLRRGMG